MTSGVLCDTTRCQGCERCIAACKRENGLGPDRPQRWQRRIDDLSATRLSTIERRPNNHYVRVQCRHCLEPACVSACLVGAMQKTPEGPVIYDQDRCMGCRYCMVACPYGIPRYDWDRAVPGIRKCSLCYPRLKRGEEPACVSACEQGVLSFGQRDDLLRIAHDRLRANPDRYTGKVAGETEIGGTSVLLISDIPLDFLAFKSELGDRPLPERTYAALSKVPPLAAGVGGLMTGLWWIIGRRMKLAEAAELARAEAAPGDPEKKH